jgi:hypothetical protein
MMFVPHRKHVWVASLLQGRRREEEDYEREMWVVVRDTKRGGTE